MKRFLILTLFFVATGLGLNAQVKAISSRVINPGEFALPGMYNPLGLNVPPISFPPFPNLPEPISIEDDISIELLPDSTGLTELSCHGDYKLYYHIRVNSAQQLRKADFRVKVSIPGMPDQINWMQYKDNNPNTVKGFFLMKYAYLDIYVRGQWIKQYYRRPNTITAICSGGFISGAITPTLILDPDKQNNQALAQFLTPLPPSCPVHPILKTKKG